MAVTDEFKQDVLEVLDEYTAQLENQTGTNATPIMPAADVDRTVSMPAVKFDADPRENSRAVPQGYYQIPVADFFNRIDRASAAVEQATSDLEDLKGRTEQARQETIDATGDAIAATTAATNVNADLTGMTVTITNRQGVSRSVNIGFEILQDHVYPTIEAMNADAANVRAGEFCMIATTDPTSPDNAQLWSRNSSEPDSGHPFTFLSDLDQASSAAFADWLENYKPVIEGDHARAEDDHTRAEGDHTRAEADHATADGDHQTATHDHQVSARQQQTFEADEAARQQTFETGETRRQADFDANEAQRQADFENAEQDRIAAMTVTRCFVRLRDMHLVFVQPASDSTQYKVRRGRLKIITSYDV